MKNLSSILFSNGITEGCPVPLWRIKVTDDQYEELKEYLIYKYTHDGSFDDCPKEAALYIAEWWKRDSGESRQTGFTNQDIAFCSIGLNHDIDGVESLFNNAKRIFDPHDGKAYIRGARLVVTQHRRMFVYSLFYQGGFPMGRACSQHGAGWRRMIAKFVRKNIDFEDLPGAVIAKKALREYKDYLVTAAREQSPEGMPFVCDKEHPWYKLAVEGVRIGDSEKGAHPFSIKWTFIRRPGDFMLRGNITGPSELSESFLAARPDVKEMDSVPIQLFRDDEFVDTLVQYEKTERGAFLSYYDVNYSFNYDGVSKITLRIPGVDKPILSSDVDMSIPHSFFRASNGQDYEMGAKFGERVSLIAYDDSWELIDAEGDHTQPVPTSFGGNPFWMIFCGVPQDDSDISFTIGKRGGDEKYSFGSELTPSWTEVKIHRPYNRLIVEDVYDFSDETQVTVIKCTDEEEEGKEVPKEDVFFRKSKSDRWSNDIPFGRIQCSIIQNEVITSPERNLLSVGPNLDVRILRFLPRECHYHISWDEGDVYSADGNVRPDENGVWIIRKEDYESVFPITCIPRVGESFHLHIRTVFRDFRIFTPAGEKLQRFEIIPWSEINSYRYSISDSSRISVRPYGEISFALNVRQPGADDGNSIPAEGALGQILTPQLLQKYEWRADEGYDFEIRSCYFTLQRYPLSLQLSDRANALDLVLSTREVDDVFRDSRERFLSSFCGQLIVFDQGGKVLFEVPRSEDGLYHLPEDLEGQVFIACNLKGYLRPIFYSNGDIGTCDAEASYSRILTESSLDDPCWDSVVRFLDAGLRFGFPLNDLPWVGAVIRSPEMFLALYCRLYITAQFDPVKIRDAKNVMNRVMSVYRIPLVDMDFIFFLTHCRPDCFPSQYAAWMHTNGKVENNENVRNEFLMWAALNVQELISE